MTTVRFIEASLQRDRSHRNLAAKCRGSGSPNFNRRTAFGLAVLN